MNAIGLGRAKVGGADHMMYGDGMPRHLVSHVTARKAISKIFGFLFFAVTRAH